MNKMRMSLKRQNKEESNSGAEEYNNWIKGKKTRVQPEIWSERRINQWPWRVTDIINNFGVTINNLGGYLILSSQRNKKRSEEKWREPKGLRGTSITVGSGQNCKGMEFVCKSSSNQLKIFL